MSDFDSRLRSLIGHWRLRAYMLSQCGAKVAAGVLEDCAKDVEAAIDGGAHAERFMHVPAIDNEVKS